jgi:hypothetical protein
MGISLFGLTPAATYPSLIKFGDNSAISGTLRALSDGLGTDLPIQVSTAGVNFTGTASIGGTAIITNSSGVTGAIQFSNGSAFASDATNFFWDDTNNRLGVGTNAPISPFNIQSDTQNVGILSVTTSGGGLDRLEVWNSNSVATPVWNIGIPSPDTRISMYTNISLRANGTTAAVFSSSEANFGSISGARVGIKGSGSTGATTSLLVQNSAGTQLLKVSDIGEVTIPYLYVNNEIRILSTILITTNADGVLKLANNAGTDFNRLQLGGTTSSFPSIKRNGTAIDIRLADDSNFASLNTNSQTITSTISLSAGATNPRIENIAYTINNSGAQTGTATGIFLNATETALNGQTHNLMDLQRDGVSRFSVSRTGIGIFSAGISQIPELTMNNSGIFAFSGRARIKSPSTNAVMFQDNTETSASNLILGLQTSSFPMLKRNGTAIDFRLADDSAFAPINAGATTIKGSGSTSATTSLLVQDSSSLQCFKVRDDGLIQLGNSSNVTIEGGSGPTYNRFELVVGALSSVPSAILSATSTTRGFLPPRMTTTQRDAIATPATGLKIYNTTLGTTDTYDGATWQRFGQQTLIKGSGSTSATTSLQVQNSAGTAALTVKDDLTLTFGGVLTTSSNITSTANVQGGNINAVGNVYIGNFQSSLKSNGSGIIQLQNTAENDFNRLQFGGTTSSFPSIKRNGIVLEARLADDSLYCNFSAAVGSFTGFNSSAFTNNYAFGSNANVKQKLVIEDGTPTAITTSALVEMKSTTLGFLPPRMTTTQKNAIASPAAGLTVYDSTTNKLNYNNGTVWKEITPDGYTGLVTINATPPVTFDIQNGIIVNVT